MPGYDENITAEAMFEMPELLEDGTQLFVPYGSDMLLNMSFQAAFLKWWMMPLLGYCNPSPTETQKISRRRPQTAHRILTSNEIIEMKTKAEEKEQKEKATEESKRICEEKK